MTMSPATKQLIQSNLKFCGSVALIFGFLGGFLGVMGLGGSVSGGAEFWGMGFLMTAAFAMLTFFPLLLLSLNLQSALICFRLGMQNNRSRMTVAAALLLLVYIAVAINFLNLAGIVMLVISGLWSFRKVDDWFRSSEAFPFEKEKAKHGLEEKPKRSTGWQPSRLLVFLLVSLLFACGVFMYLGWQLSTERDASETYAYGVAAFEAGNYGFAIDRFSRAIELEPNFADAYVARGNAYYALDNNEAALADWAQAEALGFDRPPDVEEIRNELSGNSD